MSAGNQYHIQVKKDGKFFVGYCLEITQARGQGDTAEEAVEDTKKAIELWVSYLEDKKRNLASQLVTVTI